MKVYCETCWKEINEDVSNCPSCGNKLSFSGKRPERNQQGNLILTKRFAQRLVGILVFDTSILHDIRKRRDLSRERAILVFVSLLLLVNFRLLPHIMANSYPIFSPSEQVLYSLASSILGPWVLFSAFILMGKQFQGVGPDFELRQIFLTVIYLYPLLVLDYSIVGFLQVYTSSLLVVLGIILFLYTYYLFSWMMKNLFHTTDIGSVLALLFTIFMWALMELSIYFVCLTLSQ